MSSSSSATKEPAAVSALRARWPDAIRDVSENRGQFRVTMDREKIPEALRFLRDDAELKFDFLSDLSALDHYGTEPRFRVFYVLRSMKNRDEIVLKCAVPEEDCWVPTVSDLFATANWLEREVWDMFGISFKGHPDLRRILMPEGFDDFPMRKDFPLQGKRTDQEWAEWVIARAQRLEGQPGE